MDINKYWTGMADVSSDDFTSPVDGALYRVLTFAETYDDFEEKVRDVLLKRNHVLIMIEEPCVLAEFLGNKWLAKDHEIYEMMTAENVTEEDVVCGILEYYANDA